MRTFATAILVVMTSLALPTRLHAQAGSVDLSFNPGLNSNAQVYVVTLLTNGQVLIGGSFSSIGGVNRINVARLNQGGTLDPTFNPGAAADNGYVSAIAVQPDGKVLIGGLFFSSIGAAPPNLARLNTDGSVDPGFDPDFYTDKIVNAVLVQPDGKILFGGGFAVVDGVVRRSVARLNANGTLDVGFDACVASGFGNGATALALREDRKILMSGSFTFTTGTNRNGIALLGTNGDLDITYAPQPGIESNSVAYALALRPDGRAVLGGNFRTYHGVSRGGIVQLTTNGIPDGAFDPGTGIFDFESIFALTIQIDGKAIIGGDFTGYNGQPSDRVARLNTNGTLDPAFNVGSGPEPNGPAGIIAAQSDGRILVGGRFSTFNGVPHVGLVRLKGDPGPFRLGPPFLLGGGRFQLTFYGENQAQYAIQMSSNLQDWVTFTNLTATNPIMPVVDTAADPWRFYRALLAP